MHSTDLLDLGPTHSLVLALTCELGGQRQRGPHDDVGVVEVGKQLDRAPAGREGSGGSRGAWGGGGGEQQVRGEAIHHTDTAGS